MGAIAKRGLSASRIPGEPNDRQTIETLLVSNDRLAAANVDLEAFSCSAAHDLRSPIRQISGFAKILIEEYGPQLPAEAHRFLDKVTQGAKRMDALVNDLLHLSQVGRQGLSLQRTPLASILAEALESLQSECLGRDIEWRVGIPCSAVCDRGLIKQVFVNLLSNALKFTRCRHPAVIDVGQMNVKGEHVFYVRDNGVGFDMQYAGKLFEAFERLRSAGEFEGTGIGLATVDRIIRNHGGWIHAQARPGRGAAFFFTLPPSIGP